MNFIKFIPFYGLLICFSVLIIPYASAQGPLVGDANNDCVVNGTDARIWAAYYSQDTSFSQTVGDFNLSGKTNGLDFGVLNINFSHICPATSPSPGTSPTYEQVKSWAEAYKTAHPGNGGKDWDINTKTSAQIAADPALQQLISICGPNQRPVIPIIAWEYGGTDHQWIRPEDSALVYCVYIPIYTPSEHWNYNATNDRVTADVYVLFPEQNPCRNRVGADQVLACLGDPTNSEILVDIASLNDGRDAGLPTLQNASTELKLILPDGTKVRLLINI